MSKIARFAGVLSVLSLITVFAVVSLAGASTVELVADSDSTLRRGYNNLNEGANKELFVMRDGPKRAIVSFDIGVLDPASQVVDAQMFLTVADDAVKWEDGRPVDLHRLLVSFTEGNGRKFGEPNAVKDRGTGPGVTWSCSEDTEIGNTRTDCELDWEGGWVNAGTIGHGFYLRCPRPPGDGHRGYQDHVIRLRQLRLSGLHDHPGQQDL